MIQKTLNKLVGLKIEDFNKFVKSGQIKLQSARLIPSLKTGDEMALTSIFLSSLKLVKEYRDSIFKEIKLSRSGRVQFYTEVCFMDVNTSRIDGLIIVISKGVISDAALFEMKNKSNNIDVSQIESYIEIAKKLKIGKLITVSNEFVSDPSHSPINIKTPKSISLLHFSWTFLITKARLLLFKNDLKIEDIDQVNIMAEVLYYLENPISGVSGYTQMKQGWKELAENIRAQKPLKQSDSYIEDAVLSWYEEEKDIALLLSRKLGVLVKTPTKTPNTLKNDIKKLVVENYISGILNIKNAVSDVKIIAEFERRIISMSIKLTPPLDRGNKAKITWISKQLESCQKKSELFNLLSKEIWIEADIKFARENIKVKLSELGELLDLTSGKEIQAFHIVLIRAFGVGFSSTKKFIVLIERMVLEYYESLVQHLSTWTKPSPKIIKDE